MYSLSLAEVPYNEKFVIKAGDKVIFKDEEGKEEFGIVRYVEKDSSAEDLLSNASKILRIATAHDLQRAESHAEQEERSLDACKKLVKDAGLDMTVFRAAYSFDGSKVHFMFTADDRVDFRELVKELAKKLKKQIHLRQIGPRDKAKFVGGYGRCGRTLCCNTFLGPLESINMEMVREQGLEGKGSSKLSGACGKLLCCLKYEVEAYRSLREGLPAAGSIVRLKKSSSSPEGEGKVVALDVLNRKIRIYFKGADSVVVGPEAIEKILQAPAEENIS